MAGIVISETCEFGCLAVGNITNSELQARGAAVLSNRLDFNHAHWNRAKGPSPLLATEQTIAGIEESQQGAS